MAVIAGNLEWLWDKIRLQSDIPDDVYQYRLRSYQRLSRNPIPDDGALHEE
jgi:hypothetical protein